MEGSLLLRCKKTPRYFNLFCSISRIHNCIEENLINLINLQLNNRIDLPLSEKNKSYRELLKRKINEVGRNIVKKVIRESGRKKFETCFPDLCAIFREIEENYKF